MIVEISIELLVEMFRTDNLIRSVVIEGIPRDYYFKKAAINYECGTIELLLHSPTDEGEERKPITLTDLRGTK